MLEEIIPEERAAARRLLAGSLALPPEPSQLQFCFPRSFTFARCTALLLVGGYKRPSVTWYGKKTREPRASVLKNRTRGQHYYSGFSAWLVFPCSNSSAWGSNSIAASNDSTAALGLPGRLRINDVPQIPHTPRLNAARGVFFAPSLRIRSEIPSTNRVHTARVASGVTSRAAMPVPPVVTTREAEAASRRSAASITFCSSGTISIFSTAKWFSCKSSFTAGPERSAREPAEAESLTVRTAAFIQKAASRQLPVASYTCKEAVGLLSYFTFGLKSSSIRLKRDRFQRTDLTVILLCPHRNWELAAGNCFQASTLSLLASSTRRRPSMSNPWVERVMVCSGLDPVKSMRKLPVCQVSTLYTASSPFRLPQVA